MPVDGKLIGKAIGARFPFAGAIIEMLGPRVIDAIRSQPRDKPLAAAVEAIAPTVEAIIEGDPELKNSLNLESPAESRTTVWGAGTALLGLSGVIAIAKAAWEGGEFNVEAFAIALGSLVTGVNVVRGRWASGLGPLRWTKVLMPWKWGR